jgi:carbon monoxide dehydrogenase subunit G
VRLSLQIAWFASAVATGGLSARGEEGATSGHPFLRESEASGVYALEGGFEVDAGVDVVWQVLTDFDDLPHFVPSVRSSVARKLADGGLLVAQEFEGKVLIFSRDLRVQLAVSEQPEREIVFRDTTLGDFEVYEGSWQLQENGGGTRVTYRLRAQLRDAAPDFIARGVFKNNAIEMLGLLRDEMVRRDPTSSSVRPKTTQPDGGAK